MDNVKGNKKAEPPLAVLAPASSAGVPFDHFRQATLYSSAFSLKRTLLQLVPLLLNVMHMLHCFLLLALFLALPAALVSHCAPPYCTWIVCMLSLYHVILPEGAHEKGKDLPHLRMH